MNLLDHEKLLLQDYYFKDYKDHLKNNPEEYKKFSKIQKNAAIFTFFKCLCKSALEFGYISHMIKGHQLPLLLRFFLFSQVFFNVPDHIVNGIEKTIYSDKVIQYALPYYQQEIEKCKEYSRKIFETHISLLNNKK